MSSPPLVPPIKCQGIKTKLVAEIANMAGELSDGRWVEPFCGSGVVALNLQPKRALLCDSNIHIIQFYKDIQSGQLTSLGVREFLSEQGAKLLSIGEVYFYEVRERFNNKPNSLDFLFLNRSCFNGVMRFNRSGRFNVPFCRKPERFAPAYITKIVNQVQTISRVVSVSDWEFKVADFRESIAAAKRDDFVYADPPYAGRHTDYFNGWSEQDEADLADLLSNLPCKFILSTWHSNEFRTNLQVEKNWVSEHFHIFTKAHYYHVGAAEELRHPMLEALITNFGYNEAVGSHEARQQSLFVEQQRARYATI
ncbi:MAG: DNA adenine methylase [Gallionellales bacterium RIFCSPLOWO2_12_FULL_59_22]|nr:MAG: DNA adenine methylase [Gallionellales bacterium RIFCSPLOWO2_02_FULL_59_110]OGT12737.1 MAG: DNA adenine methylase [Gallionellales bacterium RIFCSPLOWO2_12_FULL_59_22]